MKCDYCGNKVDGEKCSTCGAPKKEQVGSNLGSPFYFHGFMIYPERNIDLTEYHIWLGDTRIGSFCIDRETMMSFHRIYGEGVDPDPFLYKLLRLAIGESEVERCEERNGGRTFLIEIRRIETPEAIASDNMVRELMGA